VAGLVSAHGGTVSVRTAPARAPDFQVKLPLSPDAVAVDDADGRRPDASLNASLPVCENGRLAVSPTGRRCLMGQEF